MKPKWQKLASLAQEICTLWFQFYDAVFASKGYPFKNILKWLLYVQSVDNNPHKVFAKIWQAVLKSLYLLYYCFHVCACVCALYLCLNMSWTDLRLVLLAFPGIKRLFAYCKGGNFNIHILALFG